VARKVDDVKGKTLLPFITENVKSDSTVYTDEWHGYWAVRANGYEHHTIKHSQKIYAIGDIHTNTIEGFWSLVKGGLRGVYRNVSAKYVQTYFNEYAFRYNRRFDEQPMFVSFLNRVEKKTV
jgi:transposase